MTVLRQIVWRGVIGIITGTVIGAVSAAMLMSASPKEWLDIWKTKTNLEVYHLTWILWAAVTAIVTLLSLTIGGINFGRRAAFVIRGILCGCLTGTTLTLFAAWFNDEWPFRVKAPQTMIEIGRNFVLPGFALIGGILGRIYFARLETQNKKMQPSKTTPRKWLNSQPRLTFLSMGVGVDQERQSRLHINQLTVLQLITATLCVAVGITCLQLSFDRRFAGGSVPNVYLIVISLSLFVVIPIFHIIRRTDRSLIASLLGSLLISVFAVVAVLAFLVFSGTI